MVELYRTVSVSVVLAVKVVFAPDTVGLILTVVVRGESVKVAASVTDVRKNGETGVLQDS